MWKDWMEHLTSLFLDLHDWETTNLRLQFDSQGSSAGNDQIISRTRIDF